jgi:hypothetical protein
MYRRVTLEEAVWEAYKEIGDDLFEHLPDTKRELVRKYFGVFPYQPHTYRQLAKRENMPYTTVYYQVKIALKELKRIIVSRYKPSN